MVSFDVGGEDGILSCRVYCLQTGNILMDGRYCFFQGISPVVRKESPFTEEGRVDFPSISGT